MPDAMRNLVRVATRAAAEKGGAHAMKRVCGEPGEVAATVRAKVGTKRAPQNPRCEPHPQEWRRKKIADIRAQYAYTKCNELLDWSYFKADASNIARLSPVVEEAIKQNRGVRTASPPDFFCGPVPLAELMVINPNAAKSDVRSFASENFAWILCKKATPASCPPTFPAPSVRLESHLRRCCPQYLALCGKRYSGRALLAAAEEHADLAFLRGVWPSWEGGPPTEGRREAPTPTTVEPRTHQRPPGGTQQTVPAEVREARRDRRGRQRSLVGSTRSNN